MSIFEFNISTAIYSGMDIERRDVLSAYLQIVDQSSKKLVDNLATLGLVTINNPLPEERKDILNWLNAHPFIVHSYHNNKIERMCVPLYVSYMENDKGITINRTDSVLFNVLEDILKEYTIPELFLRRKFSARIVADMILKREDTAIYNFDELRKVLDVKKSNYVSFQQFERVFESINNDLEAHDYELRYHRLSPGSRSSDVVLELLKKG